MEFLSTGNPIMALYNSRLMKFITGMKHIEQVGEGLIKMLEKKDKGLKSLFFAMVMEEHTGEQQLLSILTISI